MTLILMMPRLTLMYGFTMTPLHALSSSFFAGLEYGSLCNICKSPISLSSYQHHHHHSSPTTPPSSAPHHQHQQGPHRQDHTITVTRATITITVISITIAFASLLPAQL